MAVEGTVFHREAMRELAPPALADRVDRSLTALVRRDLIRPDRSTIGDDDAFRFRHILIRDAAYRSLPKETRAELHERFADWLEATAAGERMDEFEEIVGYHLEQACRFLAELGHAGSGADTLAERGVGATRVGRAPRAASQRPRRCGLTAGASGGARAGARHAPGPLLPELGGALIEAGRLADAGARARGRKAGGRSGRR